MTLLVFISKCHFNFRVKQRKYWLNNDIFVLITSHFFRKIDIIEKLYSAFL